MYMLIRLDDASEHMDVDKWYRVELLLDKYNIRPIIGVIPNNLDQSIVEKYEHNPGFWDLVKKWESKGWTIALHGYTHVYETDNGGINPIYNRSEFAGLPLSKQREKIRRGVNKLEMHGIFPKLFFAPSHTYDNNTLEALRLESQIRVISDTVANDIYFKDGFHFIPQQSGKVRNLPFRVITFCYHPNTMNDSDFEYLKVFLQKNLNKFRSFEELSFTNRKFGVVDWLLKFIYFGLKKIRFF
ncbi:MAG TPA: DUF2334 domain-containing protein [Clostridiales bacterium]|nr:DUF2334 domain-containing protein [Clostridiales bacterium]